MRSRSLTPAVSRSTRLAIAGLIWTAVGIMLLTWATGWLLHVPRASAITFGFAGVGIGIFAWATLFSRLASDNAARILNGSARACLFGFTPLKGWLITVSMVVLGTVLRHSTMPKAWLAVPYSAIGVALFLASLIYYVRLSTTSRGVTS